MNKTVVKLLFIVLTLHGIQVIGQLDTHFVSTWQTDTTSTGSSNATSIEIPTYPTETYFYDVDWDNDGAFDEFGVNGNAIHDYGVGNEGTYTIRIRGDFPRIYFNNSGDKEKILSVDQWGTQTWTSMQKAFFGCLNLTLAATDNPDLSSVTDMSHMFRNASSVNQDINAWNVSSVSNMSYLFFGASTFDRNLSAWDTGNVTTMYSMFRNATHFNRNIANWNTENVSSMSRMFDHASSFNRDIGSWNVENVTNMSNMFLDVMLSIYYYDALLIGWNAQNLQPNVTFHAGISRYCDGETARNNMIGTNGWNITDDGRYCADEHFVILCQTDNTGAGSSNATSIEIPTFLGELYNYDVDWDDDGYFDEFGITGNATHDYGVGNEDSYYIRIRGDFPRIYFNNTGDKDKILYIYQWGKQQWSSMEKAFYGCSNLSGIIMTDPPILTHATDLSYMFKNATSFYQNISNWDVSNITNMSHMFEGASSFNKNLRYWNVSHVTDMSYMFANASIFNNYNRSLNWVNTSNVIDMSHMFEDAAVFNQEINSWNTSSVENMNYMFKGASDFNQNIDTWNVSSVQNMSHMFERAFDFNQDISNWNVLAVEDMSYMFKDISHFNNNNQALDWGTATSNVRDMSHMFFSAVRFSQDISNWDVSSVEDMNQMFANTNRFNCDIGSWNVSAVTDMGAMFMNASFFGQDLSNWDVSSVTAMGYMLKEQYDLIIADSHSIVGMLKM